MKISKQKEQDETSVNEIRLEINDSSSTHNNNFAITLKSKKVDVGGITSYGKRMGNRA